MFKRVVSIFVLCFMVVGLFAGCTESASVEEKLTDAVISALEEITSFKASILLDMTARVGTSSSSQGHTASISSDITITTVNEPFSYHSEYYSQILVDGVKTREDQEFYAVSEEGKYVLYEADPYDDNWTISTLTREEILALPLRTGMIQDWYTFMSYFEVEAEGETLRKHTVYELSGEVPANYIQEVIGEEVFGTWLYSLEQLLADSIPCTLYVDTETFLPVQIDFDFADSFLVTDMIIEGAVISVAYSDWDVYSEIEVPRKVSVIATDEEAEFYLSYFAWDLFLPYITSSSDGGTQSGDSSFSSSWETFELRLDGNMLKLPMEYSVLKQLGYVIDDYYSSVILEPRSVIENVPVLKNKDIILCSFYNASTSPQPISSCDVGAIDVSGTNIVQNGITVYLPGELTLGVTKDFLFTAYGDPDVTSSGFSADTYLWKGETEYQSFYAEVSTVTGQLVRFEISNVPFMEKVEPVTPTQPVETTPPAETTSPE